MEGKMTESLYAPLYVPSALPLLAVLLLTAFGRSFVTHNDLTGTAPRMMTWSILSDLLTEDSQ